ncbi:YggT family protein [Nodosilinea sp. LEGE 07088]|uniref:YggT family protein n=1 Tax=Nodosilinea sp. LEGE 07088 TaxID=2777968 RepID=UPI00187DEDC3|nr:YggT family protein [Nodosilinea sp. LEGE 07088]MBE9138457.1 YggT family protein [Nodosilinea sp. LEGE 07088]
MNDNPNQPDDWQRQHELSQKRDAYRLQQETQRLKVAQRRAKLAWVRNTIALLVGSLEILLGIRFFLRATGANPDNPFAQFISKISEPFMAPFSTLFISPTDATATRIFDINLLIAMAVYALLGGIAIAIVNYLQGQNPYGR